MQGRSAITRSASAATMPVRLSKCSFVAVFKSSGLSWLQPMAHLRAENACLIRLRI